MERCPLKSGAKSPHTKLISAIRFPEEHVFVSGSMDSTFKVWDCTTLTSVTEVFAIESREGISSLESVRLFGDGSVFLVGSQAGSLRLLDLRSRSGEGDKSVKIASFPLTSIGMSDGPMIVTGDASGRVETRDLRSLRIMPLVSMNGSLAEVEKARVSSSTAFSQVERRVPVRSTITEDMWDIAMGKAPQKRKRAMDPPDVPKPTPTTLIPSTPVQQAHSEAVIFTHFIHPTKILTVGKDKHVKQFSSQSGQLHDAVKLKEKPSTASYFHKTLFLGERGGVLALHNENGTFEKSERIGNPHVGPVTALSSCADWGLCTGGTDQHVFLYSLWNEIP